MKQGLNNGPAGQPRSGQTLVALLVVVAIMIGMYMMFLGPRTGKDGESRPSVAKQSIDHSTEVAVGGNDLSQIRTAISMYRSDNDGKPPASLEELKASAYCKGFPPEMWVDPVTKQPLVYDAATGTISNPSQGTGVSTADKFGKPPADLPAP